MSPGETDLHSLIALMQPKLLEQEYVFCTLPGLGYGDRPELNPLACYQEQEGLSLLLTRESADAAGVAYDSTFRCIDLTVHSSLDAVGFTAAVSSKLASQGISANVIAAFYHDHVFVPSAKAEQALSLLTDLGDGAG